MMRSATPQHRPTCRHSGRHLAALYSAAAGLALMSGIANGAPVTWSPTGGGDFNTAGNWNPGTVPTVADDAIFPDNASGNIALSGAANPLRLSFRKTTGALTIDAAGNTMSLGSTTAIPQVILGTAAGQQNDITLTGGDFTATHTTGGASVQVGNFNGSNGNKLTITGAGTNFTSPSTSGTVGAVGIAGSNNNTLSIENNANMVFRGSMAVGVIGATPSSGNLLNVNTATFSLTGGSRGLNLRSGTFTMTRGYSDLGFLDADDANNSSTINFNSGTMYSRRTQIDNTRDFVIGDGGADSAIYGFAYSGGTLTLGAAGRPADLVINSNGVLTGAGTGTLTGGGIVRGITGAKVMPSIIGQPVLASDDRDIGTMNFTADWDNSNIEMVLDAGDFPAAAAAMTPFTPLDVVNITGAFTHGGVVTFNLVNYVEPDTAGEFKVVGWTSEAGDRSLTSIQFVGGSPLPTRFDTDGLYITVPEPTGLLAIAGVPLLVRRRRS